MGNCNKCEWCRRKNEPCNLHPQIPKGSRAEQKDGKEDI